MLNGSTLKMLLEDVIGSADTASLTTQVHIDPLLASQQSEKVSRAVLAQALNLLLLRDLLTRAPTGALYVADLASAQQKLVFDHGAVRTVALAGMGGLPAGEAALTRILIPLGYAKRETYPLDQLCMTGRSYAHLDFPETLPQFFVSELHVERFSQPFAAAALRVTQTSSDPLSAEDLEVLADLAERQELDAQRAAAFLPKLVSCFTRQHADPALADYQTLLAESAEMAWIATEGNAFNHATDRVADIDATVARQRALGRPLKATVEVSTSGRIQQTAFLADAVKRRFVDGEGRGVVLSAPGSFFEFIQRRTDPATGELDLSFDSSNAQGIFKMTSARAVEYG